MDKQKQMIEEKKEIAKELDKVYPNAKFTNGWIAEVLYKLGYRKIPEGAVVLTREEYEWLTCCFGKFEEIMNDIKEQAGKETAEKFAERLKEQLNEWLEDNEDLDGKINFGIAQIELIGVKSLDGEIIAESLIEEICKEITEGKNHE